MHDGDICMQLLPLTLCIFPDITHYQMLAGCGKAILVGERLYGFFLGNGQYRQSEIHGRHNPLSPPPIHCG